MSNVDPKVELFMEGLASYQDVKEALKAFEGLAAEVARRVMAGYLDEFRSVTGQPKFTEQGIKTGAFDFSSSQVAVGAWADAPDTWGVRWGIKWVPAETFKPGGAEVFMSVRVSAQWKQDRIYKAMAGGEIDPGINLEKLSGWGYDVQVSSPIPPDTQPAQVEELLDKVVSSFLKLASRSGNFKAAIETG